VVEGVFGRPERPDRFERSAPGRRDRSLVSGRRGKHSRHRLMRAGDHDVAVDATLRAAALRAGRHGVAPSVEQEDLRRRVREHRVPFELCVVVDNSYSLQAARLVEQVKGLVFALLDDAVGSKDRVSLVAFTPGRAEAALALRPTRSLRVASRRLRTVPLSGRTPLAHALLLARRVLRQELAKRPNARPVVVVVSDGLPNVPLRRGGDPVRDLLGQARALRRAHVACLVVDAAPPGTPGVSAALAEAADGRYVPVDELAPRFFLDVLDRIA
jgi:magnesium chelatase subunit D